MSETHGVNNNFDRILADYADGSNLIEAAISGLTEAHLDLALTNHSWTIRQMVHHLADGDDVWKMFIKHATGNPGREFNLAWYWQIPQDI
jgi:hypothetical protein